MVAIHLLVGGSRNFDTWCSCQGSKILRMFFANNFKIKNKQFVPLLSLFETQDWTSMVFFFVGAPTLFSAPKGPFHRPYGFFSLAPGHSNHPDIGKSHAMATGVIQRS